jgi:hypothetical protein
MDSRRRALRVLIPVFGGLILAGIGGILALPWLKGTGCVIAGLGAGLSVRDSIRDGVLRSNWGTVTREESPLRFRIEAGFWILLVAAMTLAGLLYARGVIGAAPLRTRLRGPVPLWPVTCR